jgi:hypothetical protein
MGIVFEGMVDGEDPEDRAQSASDYVAGVARASSLRA